MAVRHTQRILYFAELVSIVWSTLIGGELYTTYQVVVIRDFAGLVVPTKIYGGAFPTTHS